MLLHCILASSVTHELLDATLPLTNKKTPFISLEAFKSVFFLTLKFRNVIRVGPTMSVLY